MSRRPELTGKCVARAFVRRRRKYKNKKARGRRNPPRLGIKVNETNLEVCNGFSVDKFPESICYQLQICAVLVVPASNLCCPERTSPKSVLSSNRCCPQIGAVPKSVLSSNRCCPQIGAVLKSVPKWARAHVRAHVMTSRLSSIVSLSLLST